MKRNIFIKLLSLIIFVSLTSLASADNSCNKVIESNSTINKSMTFECNTEIGANFDAVDGSNIEVYGDLKLGSNADIDGNLVVYGDLELSSNATINGNLIVLGDIKGENSNLDVLGIIRGKNINLGSGLSTTSIISNGNIDLGSNGDVTNGIETNGYLKTGANFTLNGNSIIRGDFITGSNFDGNANIYVYGNFESESNYTFEGNKLKITKNLNTGSNGDNIGRIYIFGKNDFGANYSEKNSALGYLIGDIDPLLQYNLSEKKFNEVKNKVIYSDKIVYHLKKDALAHNRTLAYIFSLEKDKQNTQEINNVLYKLNKAKKDSIEEYKNIFKYLDEYIENEDFDINKYNKVKETRLTNLKNYMNNLYGIKVNVNIEKISKKEINDELKEKLEENKNNFEKEMQEKEQKVEENTEDKEESEENIKNENNEEKTENENIALPKQLESKLQNFANNLDYNKKENTYKTIIISIDKAVKKEHKHSNILKAIKIFLENDLASSKLLEEIGIE